MHSTQRLEERPAGGYTISEYAALKRVHPVTVKRWLSRGLLEVERITRRSVRILGVKKR
jgi:DNA-directed RNA polymerase specialized sigma24 family protein